MHRERSDEPRTYLQRPLSRGEVGPHLLGQLVEESDRAGARPQPRELEGLEIDEPPLTGGDGRCGVEGHSGGCM